MESKSSNIISKKEMLPLFQVISDLENTQFSNTSTKNNFSSCSSIFSDSNKYDGTASHNKNDNLVSDTSYISHVEVNSDSFNNNISNIKRRNKKRRRLKQAKSMQFSRSSQESADKNKHRNSKYQSKEIVFKPDIHSTINREKLVFPEVVKRQVGLFSSLSFDTLHDREVDLSRHFKDIDENMTNVEMTDGPIYEIPREVKQIHGLNHKGTKNVEDENNFFDKILVDNVDKNKLSKRAIIRKYERMLEMLIHKCKEKNILISDKNLYLMKMKNKLKQVLIYNNQFAEENEYMKRQHEDMKNCIGRYKNYVQSLEEQQQATEQRRHSDSVVQVACPRCSIIELSAIKIEKENTKLNEDIVMLKNVVFRLNVQLSRYQDKLFSSNHTSKNKISLSLENLSPVKDVNENQDDILQENNAKDGISIPSLPNFSNFVTDQVAANKNSSSQEETKKIHLETCMAWGDVNTHTLAPLLNAYQESLMEKDDLIHDYEKEFNRFTVKIKQIIEENNELHKNFSKVQSDFFSLRENYGLTVKERDDLRKENDEFKEKSYELEKKLQHAYENFEQKIETMSRDYTLIHQEYFKTKTGLAAAQGKCQALEDQQKNLQSDMVVPIAIHNSKIEECKTKLDELKNKYELDKNKLNTRLSILEETNNSLDKKHISLNNDKYNLELKVKSNDRMIKKLKNTIVAYKKEISSVKTSRDAYKKRAEYSFGLNKRLTEALHQNTDDSRFQQLKTETMTVQKEAMKELEVLEKRLKDQDEKLIQLREDNKIEIMKFEGLIREKDAKIEAMKRHIQGERFTKYSDAKPKILMGLGKHSSIK